MTSFVISYNFFFLFGDNFVLFFQSTYHPVNSILKITHIYSVFIFSGCNQGCFVTNIGNICTSKARCLFGQFINFEQAGYL